MMKKTLLKLRILGELLLFIILEYIAFSVAFPISMINMALIVIGVFVLFDACELIDNENHFGRFKDSNNDETPNES